MRSIGRAGRIRPGVVRLSIGEQETIETDLCLVAQEISISSAIKILVRHSRTHSGIYMAAITICPFILSSPVGSLRFLL